MCVLIFAWENKRAQLLSVLTRLRRTRKRNPTKHEAMVFCTECGTNMDAGARFCTGSFVSLALRCFSRPFFKDAALQLRHLLVRQSKHQKLRVNQPANRAESSILAVATRMFPIATCAVAISATPPKRLTPSCGRCWVAVAP